MRLVTCAVLLTLAAGIAEACSAFVPFDEYAGPPLAETDAGRDAGATSDAGPDANVACKDADLKTDPNNCGACAHPCGGCDAGLCPTELLSDGPTNITALDIGNRDPGGASEAIYFVRSSGTLARIDSDGGRYEEALVHTNAAPLAYATSNGVVSSRTDAIDVFSRDRFLDAGVTQIVPPRNKLGPLLYESGNVLWSDDDGAFFAAATRADASVSQLSDAGAIGITSFNGVSFWTDENGLVRRTSSQSPDFFVQVLPATTAGITGIAVNQKHIYLTQRSQGVLVYDWNGTTAKGPTIVASADPELVVIDDSHIYVYNAGPAAGHRQILRYELDGTGYLVLANALTAVRALAVDATYLYFADQTKLMRIVK